ncbi:hypothetical protein V495_02322 [Pseudogymnoascus sp. VKM F-4514 (FW-929)]|nr:hypothetical protein V495_02322 [Pseudogymnoascus sp. VKM F-4514 (FW-929)]
MKLTANSLMDIKMGTKIDFADRRSNCVKAGAGVHSKVSKCLSPRRRPARPRRPAGQNNPTSPAPDPASFKPKAYSHIPQPQLHLLKSTTSTHTTSPSTRDSNRHHDVLSRNHNYTFSDPRLRHIPPVHPLATTTAITMSSPDLADLLPSSYKSLIATWLAEDCPSFDPAGYVVGSSPRTATLFGKSNGILAGVPFFTEVFAQCGCTVDWHLPEGSAIAPAPGGKVRVATVSGPTRQPSQVSPSSPKSSLNAAAPSTGTCPKVPPSRPRPEARSASRQCVATASHEMVELVKGAGYTGILAGTRKTTPGFRVVEKYGMLVGGADGHRHDLSSMIMLKDNHIWARGSITEAVKAARKVGGFALKIEVEVDSEEGADEAIEAGADVVMLDNFGGEGLKVAAKSIRGRWAGKKGVLLECSGGLTRENVREYVCNDIDIISTSAIHQGVPHVDFSLKIDH